LSRTVTDKSSRPSHSKEKANYTQFYMDLDAAHKSHFYSLSCI
jgi:hypothetical protein